MSGDLKDCVMPTMEVDGKKITWEGRKTILQACLDDGIALPYYCYHQGLSIVASCRVCLVEVEAPHPKAPTTLVKIPKLLPSCQMLAADGMKVYSQTPKALSNQKAVLEYLLINHPLDCPVCDKSGECYLQDYSYKYGRTLSRFDEDKAKKPKKDIGPHILLYNDRCINCTRCVRFTREISGTGELGVFGRGFRQEIDVFQGRVLDNPLAGNVVDICPVGALLDKDFLFVQRVWYLTQTPSISPFTSGGENIFIEHNQGRVYRIMPRFNKDINQWWIDDQIRHGWHFIHENRLWSPLVRAGANAVAPQAEIGNRDAVRTTWDQALDRLEQIFKKMVADRGPGTTALVLSPFDPTEEMFLAASWIRSIDPQAWVTFNPPQIDGEDRVFKNPLTGTVNYVLRAEQAPNRRGAEKILAHFRGHTCALTELAGKIEVGQVAAAMVHIDPVAHSDTPLEEVLARVDKLVVLSTRPPVGMAARAVLALPVSTWAEKSGVYENHAGRIQFFEKAIAPPGLSRSSGEIFWDLLGETGAYDSAAARALMVKTGLTEYAGVAKPRQSKKVKLMQFEPL